MLSLWKHLRACVPLLPVLLLAGCGDRELTTAANPPDGASQSTASSTTGVVIGQI